VNILQNSIARFVFEKVVISIAAALLIGTAVGMLWGSRILLSFISGYVTGCIYFLLLSHSISYIFNRKPGKVKKLHFSTFAVRYSLMALILASLVKYTNINVFAFIAGLTVINAALFISAFMKKAVPGGGGEYGRA
jgi:hypothetical protein